MPRFPPHPDRRPALVTGASSGIGAATAVALASAGHPVVLGARRIDRCAEVAGRINAAGGEAIVIGVDLADADSVAAFCAEAMSRMDGIEVLVSNAGDVQPISADADPIDFLQQTTINLLAPQRLVHHLIRPMVERQRGDVIFVTSEVAISPRPHMAGYVAAKAGLENLAHGMRMELEGTGVRVGIVRPGPAATEQGSTWDPERATVALQAWERFGLVRHAGTMLPAHVASAVVAMASVPRGSQFAVLEVQPEAPINPIISQLEENQ